jgi:hypothetical protein
VQIFGRRQVRIRHYTIIGENTWINVNPRAGADPEIVIGDNCFLGRRNFLDAGAKLFSATTASAVPTVISSAPLPVFPLLSSCMSSNLMSISPDSKERCMGNSPFPRRPAVRRRSLTSSANDCGQSRTIFTPTPADFPEWTALPPEGLWKLPDVQNLCRALVTRVPMSFLGLRRAFANREP